MTSKMTNKFSPEERARAVRMVLDHEAEPSRWATIMSIAGKIGCTAQTLNEWVKKLRRAVRARGHFPTDEAAMKLLFLVLNRSEKEWKMAPVSGSWPRPSSPQSSASASTAPWRSDVQPAARTRKS
jgi:transposase-like protein